MPTISPWDGPLDSISTKIRFQLVYRSKCNALILFQCISKGRLP